MYSIRNIISTFTHYLENKINEINLDIDAIKYLHGDNIIFKKFQCDMNKSTTYENNKKFYINGIFYHYGLYYYVDYEKSYELFQKSY